MVSSIVVRISKTWKRTPISGSSSIPCLSHETVTVFGTAGLDTGHFDKDGGYYHSQIELNNLMSGGMPVWSASTLLPSVLEPRGVFWGYKLLQQRVAQIQPSGIRRWF
jgi:hypothetical protein